MVFSSVFATIINRFLSPFVDELTANQLNVFAWSGKVSLLDVSVKPNAFDSLKLPFRIVHGHIGRIDGSVPWMNIYNEPIVIQISDVYVVAVPNSEITYNEEDEKRYEWAVKKSYLENIENMKQKIIDEYKEDKKDDDGFFMKLIVAAIKNIQISINNIHVCYEDSSTYKSHVFQVGVSFSKLAFVTETDQKSDNDNLIHKTVKLEGLSVYLNSKKVKRLSGLKAAELTEVLKSQISTNGQLTAGLEYILCPITFNSTAAIHRRPEADDYHIPIVDVNMKLDSFHVELTNNQVSTLLLLVDTIDRMNCAAPYRKWRPHMSIKANPRAWWKFMFTATVETGIRRKKREFSWHNILATCEKRKAYTEMYKRKLLGGNTVAAVLESYEKELNLTTIVIARSQAEFQTKSILESRKKTESKKGWFSGWWSSSSSTSASSDDKTSDTLKSIKDEFTPEEKQKLYKAIDYEEDAMFQLYPVEFISHQCKFEITTFKVVIKQEETSLMNLEFYKFCFEFFNRQSSGNISLKCHLDRLTAIGRNNVKLLRGKEQEKQFLSFKFEMNPLDKQFDFGIDLDMKSSLLMYDIETINHLYQMLKPPKNLSEEISSYAQYKFTDLKELTSTGIAYALEKHKQLKLNIKLEPSFVVVPQAADISKANSVVLISFGEFYLTSKPVPKSNIRKIYEMLASKADMTTLLEEIRKLAYEKYTCHLRKVQVVLSDVTNWKEDIWKLDTERHMLFPFEIKLDFGRSVVPQVTYFPKMEFSGEIPQIRVKTSEVQVSQLLSLFISLPYGPTIKPKTKSSSSVTDSTRSTKIITYSDEVVDACNYATKAVENLETAEKEPEDDKSEDDIAATVSESMDIVDIGGDYPKAAHDLIFEFNLRKIDLCIYSGDRRAESMLAQIKLVRLSVDLDIMGEALMINCSVCDLQLDDSRLIRKEGIRTMLAKSIEAPVGDEPQSKPILLVCFCQTAKERAIAVTMSGFTYSFALDYMLLIIDFTTKAFAFPEETSSSKPVERLSAGQSSKAEAALSKSNEVVNVISVDMNKIEVIMLQSLEMPDAVACVFNCGAQINIRLDKEMIKISGKVEEIHMGVANYLRYRQCGQLEEYVMSPTNLDITGEIKGSKQMFDLAFSPIYISISPEAVSVVLGILSTMGSASKADNGKVVEQCEFTDDMLQPQLTDRKAWYLNIAQPAYEAIELMRETNSRLTLKAAITVLIRSSGLHSQPLIRLSNTFDASLTNNKKFEFDLGLVGDYFNTSQLEWEPLIEPVEGRPFKLKGVLDLEESCNRITLEARETMEVLLTKSSVNALSVIGTAFSSVLDYKKESLAGFEKNRIIIRNSLGIPLVLDLVNSKLAIVDGKNNVAKDKRKAIIKPGENCHFMAGDIACVSLLVDLQFSDSVVVQRKIVCSTSSVRCYFASIKTYPVNEKWRWIVRVHDTGSTKAIDFCSSTQIVNYFDQPFDIYSYDGHKTSFVGTVDKFGRFPLPLSLVYSQTKLHIRPSDYYEVSDQSIDWRSITITDSTDSLLSSMCNSSSRNAPPSYLVICCAQKNDSAKHFKVKVRGEKETVLYEDTEQLNHSESHLFSIKLIPFVRLKNLLPFDVEICYHPVLEEVSRLKPGEEKILPFIVFGSTYINYRVLNYCNCDWICTAMLPESGLENESHYYDFKTAQGDEKMCLAVNYSIEKNSLVLSIFSPFWMVNETNKDITYKVDSHHEYRQPKSLPSKPLLLSFNPATVSKKDKLSLSLAGSHFSNYFPLNAVPYTGSLLLKFPSEKYTLFVNVHVELARFGLTKIIKVSAFYNIYNISKQDIEYSENGEDWFLVGKECSTAFYPTRATDQTMCFRFVATDFASKSVSLRSSSQTLLPIQGRYLFVEVDVTEMEGKVKISDYAVGHVPVLIVNEINEKLYYGQKGVTNWETRRRVYSLNPRHSVYFCWIDPLKPREFVFQLESTLEDEPLEQSISLDYDRVFVVNGRINCISFFDDQQRVLVFSYDQELPNYLLQTDELTKPNLVVALTMKGLGINVVNNETKKDLLYLTINSSYLWEERASDSKQFKLVSLKESTIFEEIYQWKRNAEHSPGKSNPHPKYKGNFQGLHMHLEQPRKVELRRTSNRGLRFRYSRSDHITQYHVEINRIQIDNQLPDHIFEVVFCPVIVPKSVSDNHEELKQKNFIEFMAIVQKQGSLMRYKHMQLLIQEFMVQVDLGWVNMITAVLDCDITKEESTQAMITQDLESILHNNMLEEMQKLEMRRSYIDCISLGPIKAHLSVSMGDLPDGQFPFGLDFIIRFTGLTVGQINDALIKLDCFERKMVAISTAELANQVSNHYKMQVYAQAYKLLLGLDIIGNPMKLVLGITKGVGDFFYEPAMGIVQGPEEFAEGIATGIRSLASGVLGGTAGALGRIGNRLGTGVAALTIDEKFQKERRERMNRKGGFAESGKNLFRGIFDGITGVVTKPIEGAREQGVEGLFKGVGRGVVGVVAQPATTVIDFASDSFHAFNDVIDPKQVARAVRPPRNIEARSKLTPYVRNSAEGAYILKTLSEGKYAGDGYEMFYLTSANNIVLLTKKRIFFLKKSIISSSWEIDWLADWTNCEKVNLEIGRLRIFLKHKNKTLHIFSGANSRVISKISEDHLKDLYDRINRLISFAEENTN